jgi:hypothetical protein
MISRLIRVERVRSPSIGARRPAGEDAGDCAVVAQRPEALREASQLRKGAAWPARAAFPGPVLRPACDPRCLSFVRGSPRWGATVEKFNTTPDRGDSPFQPMVYRLRAFDGADIAALSGAPPVSSRNPRQYGTLALMRATWADSYR